MAESKSKNRLVNRLSYGSEYENYFLKHKYSKRYFLGRYGYNKKIRMTTELARIKKGVISKNLKKDETHKAIEAYFDTYFEKVRNLDYNYYSVLGLLEHKYKLNKVVAVYKTILNALNKKQYTEKAKVDIKKLESKFRKFLESAAKELDSIGEIPRPRFEHYKKTYKKWHYYSKLKDSKFFQSLKLY